ncbi:hypothetical protein RB195_008198 [Necator americanus]|uniref:Histone-lysine N-methyltransferase SETMAR n=1 Tax=Necator americanus TaxID=51031 RepID=A0ABR1CMF7_NECAM
MKGLPTLTDCATPGQAGRPLGSSWNLPFRTAARQHDSYCRGLLRSTAKTARQDPQGAPEARHLELGWEVLPHPPYNPVLVPSKYHLFRLLQHHLEEKCYDDRDYLENDLQAFFASNSPEFYAKFAAVIL